MSGADTFPQIGSLDPGETPVATDDFRINASVHTALVRFWIDTVNLEFGTSNGVVYLRGDLRRLSFRSRKENGTDDETPFLARRLDLELKQINGVRDIVYDLRNVAKVNGRWVQREAS